MKPEHGYSSVGLTERSRVENAGQLREQAAEMIRAFGGALIEEFVGGREFSVLVASNPANAQEPITYLPIEHQFEPGHHLQDLRLQVEMAHPAPAPALPGGAAHQSCAR